MKFMFRARNNLFPFNLQKYFQLNYIINIYFIDERIYVRTYGKASCLSITGPILWNNLDNSIRKNFNLLNIAIQFLIILLNLEFNF